MDQAFDESLTKFEECRVTVPASSGSAAGGLSGEKSQNRQAGQQAGQQGSENASLAAPVKSRGISGNETPKTQPSVVTGDALPQGTPLGNDTSTGLRQNASLQNGKSPEDIPPADNDDEFAKQLRHAAQMEQDAAQRAQLWNEYRRYRGLPEKYTPENSAPD